MNNGGGDKIIHQKMFLGSNKNIFQMFSKNSFGALSFNFQRYFFHVQQKVVFALIAPRVSYLCFFSSLLLLYPSFFIYFLLLLPRVKVIMPKSEQSVIIDVPLSFRKRKRFFFLRHFALLNSRHCFI